MTNIRQSMGQHQSLRQDLRINPRLYQAMDLLYMPLLDLQQHLKQELLENPFLELIEPESEEAPESTLKDEKQAKDEESAETNWEEILLDGFSGGGGGVREDADTSEFRERVTVQGQGLADHLRSQIQLLDLDERQKLLAETIIGDISDDGYMTVPLEEVAQNANDMLQEFAAEHENLPEPAPFTAAEVEAALKVIQNLDPPGIGARDLRECLVLQLKDQKRTDSLEYRLLEEAYDDFIAHRWSELGKRLGIDPQQVQDAADLVAKLDPKPGLRYSASGEDYIVPDLIVEKIDGEYRVYLNDQNLPRLRLSRAYREVARDKKKFVGENRDFITQRLNSAQWMIQAIEQRRQTMLKVMHFIVDRQREFFDKGIEYLKPLTLREVAEVINMHESTVSRVTNEKWVQTPRGVLPLKFFFSSALATTSGEDASARAIRAQIEKLVKEEDPLEPLTDQQIVQRLREKGVRIARRTVAKYRDQLGILSARMRRRV
jgi:RNA polymerase sigma-54 factor